MKDSVEASFHTFAKLFAPFAIATLVGCPETTQVTAETKKPNTTGSPKPAQASSTAEPQVGPVGPKGDPGTPAPLSYGAHSSAPNDSLYIDDSGNLGMGITAPMSSFHLTKGQQISDTQLWSSPTYIIPKPLLVLGGDRSIKTNSGIQSLLHINSWTPYRGHDVGGAITMGKSWNFDAINDATKAGTASMMTRIATQTDVGNSHASRLKLQTTKGGAGWNEGLTIWESGSVSIGESWLTAGVNSASLSVKGVSSLPLLNLAAESDGTSKVLVDASGNVGIGVTPVRSLHIGSAMRLQPIASPPASPSNGDLYFDSSDALCVKVTAGWTKIAGSGSCD